VRTVSLGMRALSCESSTLTLIIFSTPLFNVIEDEGHPSHAPSILIVTTPVASSNATNTISPPSSCTAGLIRVSNNSLIIATVSLSSSLIVVASVSPSYMIGSNES